MACSGTCWSNDCESERPWNNPKSFNDINGTPIKEWDGNSWVLHTDRAETCFYNQLVDWIQDLRYFSSVYGNSNFNTLEFLGDAGAGVCKPDNATSCHDRGRAYDLEHVRFNGYNVKIYTEYDWQSPERSRRRRYLAVDAVCRMHFKYVLDGWYGNWNNDNHVFHIHMEDRFNTVLDKDSHSDTLFVKAVCNNFNGAGLNLGNADWTTATQDAWRDLNRAMGFRPADCDVFTNEIAYQDWLRHVAAMGFWDAGASAQIYRSPLCGPG